MSIYVLAAFSSVVSFLAAYWLIPVVGKVAVSKEWTDTPDHRKVHTKAVPSTGGVAIASASLIGLAAFWLSSLLLGTIEGTYYLPQFGIIVGAVAIACVGFWDDLFDLDFRLKFATQIAVSGLVIASGFKITLFSTVLGDGLLGVVFSVLLTIVWMVGVMNAVNLLDGLDGLAAGVVAIGMAALSVIFFLKGDVSSIVLAVVVIGALVGFLKYNFNPASIFMGDSGSLFLGFVLGAYALRGASQSHPILNLVIPVVAIGLPILDTATSMIRRKVVGLPMFAPDRDHIHHRLEARFSTKGAVLTSYGISVLFAICAIVMAVVSPMLASMVFGIGTLGVIAFLVWLGYFTSKDNSEAQGIATMPVESGEGLISRSELAESRGDGYSATTELIATDVKSPALSDAN